MVQNIEEYKKNRISKLVLPSGLEVEVHEITPFVFLRIQKELGIEPTADHFYSYELVQKLFETFFVNPKIPDDISIEDLKREDYIFLHNLIFNNAFITEEIKK